MLSLPHLVVLFVIALVIFGPEKLPELARMLGKATAEFRKITTDFRYALEDEVRDLERQTRIREEEIASAARAVEPPPAPPEGTLPRELPSGDSPSATAAEQSRLDNAEPPPPEPVSASHEKPSDDTAV
jgi:TatA/E family protein of Tat protein translocase